MSQVFPETVALVQAGQKAWLAQMKERGLPVPMYTDWEDGLPNGKPTNPSPFPVLSGVADMPAAETPAVDAVKPRKEGALKGNSKAELAREVMRNSRGFPLDQVIEMIMKATGHDKALAKATYKANAARVGITL